MDPLRRFVTESVDASYVLGDLLENEDVVAIDLEREGNVVPLVVGTDVLVFGSRLTFAAGVLKTGDVIAATVAIAPMDLP